VFSWGVWVVWNIRHASTTFCPARERRNKSFFQAKEKNVGKRERERERERVKRLKK
jgi:hypothetical protein